MDRLREETMRLNLGCGHKPIEGFVNVDLAGNWSGKKPDVEADITQRLPFDDESADEIHSYHAIEHIERYQVADVLRDWIRVLKPGGLLVLECPCLDKILGHFIVAIKAKEQPNPHLTTFAMFGNPLHKNPAMMHRWCYGVAELRYIMEQLGLTVEDKPPETHVKSRDMRLEGRK